MLNRIGLKHKINEDRKYGKEGTKVRIAVTFLKENLAKGPMKTGDLQRLGKEKGIVYQSLYEASKRLSVQRNRTGNDNGGSVWALEDQAPKVLRAAKRATPPQSSCSVKDVLEFLMSKQSQKCFTLAESHRINKWVNERTFAD